MTKEQTIRKKENLLPFTFLAKKGEGFTLVELMVAISIIAILSLIMIPNYRSFQKDLALQRAATQLAQDIRRAQGMAMAAKEQGDACSSGPTNFHYAFGLSYSTQFNCSIPISPCRYRYILFTDCNGNNTYQWNPDEDYFLMSPDFSNVQILSLDSFFGDMIFMPPGPIVLFDNDPSITEVSVVISLRDDPSKTKTITVNKAGLITIQ